MDNYANTFTVMSRPYYNSTSQCYSNILTINILPQGPLRKFTRRLNMPALSSYQYNGPCNPREKCVLALYKIGGDMCCNGNNLMNPNDIPDLMSFLLHNGYQVETQITNMMNQSQIKPTNQKICFTGTYYGNKPVKVVYTR